MAEREVRVLVAEDNPFIADLVRTGLARALKQRVDGEVRFAFENALDGKEALSKLTAQRFDILILDVMMPVLDGVQLLRLVRADPRLRATKVLAMSAGGAEAEQDVLRAGADFFLEKPIQLSLLVETLLALLQIPTKEST
jgi:two-component system chemotaxis response regulator CheY